MEKEYTIYNLIKKYEKYFDENIILKTNDEIINFNLTIKSFSHLIGLYYINKGKLKAYNEVEKILKNKDKYNVNKYDLKNTNIFEIVTLLDEKKFKNRNELDKYILKIKKEKYNKLK